MKWGPIVFAVTVLAAASADAARQSQPGQGASPAAGQDRPAGRDATASAPEIKPYEKVITKDAQSDEGIFTVHRIKEKVYYEIPKKELGKDFLWVSQLARTTIGVGYGGQPLGNRVVRWERKGDRILLRNIVYDVVAGERLPIAAAVAAANNSTIVMAFNIEAIGKDEAPVIEVTKLFTTEVSEFSARTRLRASGFDAARSFVERIVSFPENIEVEASHTFTAQPPSPNAPPSPVPPPAFGGAGMRPGSATVQVHFSMVKLPERPMMPRVFDERVGYFGVSQYDYGREEHKAVERTYITRWRLDKKDPNAEKSEPVKPITFYVDPATPAQWVPWVKKGIEDWQPAFEEAGFVKAIVAKEAPANDPGWSAEDARYSVIRWLPSTIENAMGPHVSDPRTGEILEADVQIYHNVMNLARDWYFVQSGPLDPRAKTLPLPEPLMGRLLEYVIAHEVGHSLGFQHNFKASSLYPLAKVRDPAWVKTMGHVSTLMDYSRFNYVAQPEDHIDPDDLIPKIGPYDRWATMWGYRPIPGAKSPDEEKKTLDEWARAQDQTEWLRFNTAGAMGVDPGEQTEAVGDADAVEASTLGLRNLKRVMDMLVPATTTRTGEPYDDLTEVYGRVLGQWVLEMNHVVPLVGGYDSRQRHIGQDGVRFQPVSRERQTRAMKFLDQNAFATPALFIRADVLRRIEPSGILDRVRSSQQRILASLLSPARFVRLVEQQALDGESAYAPTEFMSDVRKAIWRELESPKITVDPYRRALQRTYLDVLNERLNGRQAAGDDARAIMRAELKDLDATLRTAVVRSANRLTRAHLLDARDQIAKILDPKIAPASPALAAGARPAFDEEWPEAPESCWPDYIIRGPKK